ncbi:MAG: cobalt-precorrin-6A reductase [Hyphomicrobiaceae bacterium]
MRLLILGGTSEATRLAARLVDLGDVEPVLSLAGRTRAPAVQPVPTRIGGFGGADGLARYLRDEEIGAVVDATHPFAARISANAASACAAAGVPLVAYTRPPWRAVAGDRWIEVADFAAAAAALGEKPRNVLLTIGRLEAATFARAPQHRYVLRSIDPPEPRPDLPHLTIVLERPPFDEVHERALIAAHAIDVLVTKNSGGTATGSKLAAARALGLPVVMIARPARPAGVPVLTDLEEVLGFLARHGAAP